MSRVSGGRRRRVRVAGLVVAALLATAGCAGSTAPSARGGGSFSCTAPRTASVDWTAIKPVGAGPSPSLPVTVTDASGTVVTVTDASRILALDANGTLATTVYALGLGDHLVGRDVSTGLPALADLPVVTHSGHQLSAEAILDLAPTVILTDYTIGPLEVQLQLRDAGIPVVILDSARSRATIGPEIQAVARVLGVPAAGRALAERTDAQIAETRAYVESIAPADPSQRPRIAFLYVRGNASVYYWFGSGTGADDLIAALGAVDVASQAGMSGQKPLNAEGLIAAAPDLYLMMSNGLASAGGVDGLAAMPGIGDTAAARSHCVVDMSDYQVLAFGPLFPAVLRALADAVYAPAGAA